MQSLACQGTLELSPYYMVLFVGGHRKRSGACTLGEDQLYASQVACGHQTGLAFLLAEAVGCLCCL